MTARGCYVVDNRMRSFLAPKDRGELRVSFHSCLRLPTDTLTQRPQVLDKLCKALRTSPRPPVKGPAECLLGSPNPDFPGNSRVFPEFRVLLGSRVRIKESTISRSQNFSITPRTKGHGDNYRPLNLPSPLIVGNKSTMPDSEKIQVLEEPSKPMMEDEAFPRLPSQSRQTSGDTTRVVDQGGDWKTSHLLAPVPNTLSKFKHML